jgi:hypothetical protein
MEQQFTQLGTGQAFITVLNEKGIPTATVVTHLMAPYSVMGPLSENEYQQHLNSSDAYDKYKDSQDPQSAFEILSGRMKEDAARVEEAKQAKQAPKGKQEKSTFEEVINSPVAKQVGRELVRGVFGVLFGTGRRKKGLF